MNAIDLCPLCGAYWACSCRQDADTAAWKQAIEELDGQTSIEIGKWRQDMNTVPAGEVELEIGDETCAS